MQQTVVPLLTRWQNFYVIIGSSAAALTGLMFIVITLIAGLQENRSSGTIGVFGTPTVVHFCSILLIAALLAAPWPELWNVGIPLGLIGLSGVIYIAIVLGRARRQTGYQPVLEDWLCHTIFPLISYAVLLISAILLLVNPVLALFIVAAVTILLLFVSIHNAWDTVTYIVIEHAQPDNKSEDKII